MACDRGRSEMKVAYLLESLGGGGAERSTTLLVERLPDHGVHPVVLCLKRASEGDHDRLERRGVELLVAPGGGFARDAKWVRDILRDHEPDILHTAVTGADLVGRVAAFGTGVPVVSSLINTPYGPARFAADPTAPWRIRGYQVLDAVTGRLGVRHFHAVTAGVAEHAVRHLRVLPSRITVVERGRDQPARPQKDASAIRAELGVGGAGTLVVGVGRLERQKGFDVLLRAVAALGDRGQHVSVALLGRPGGHGVELSRLSRQLGLEGRVHQLGYRADALDVVAAADVFVSASHYEGAAGALLEALALGTPVVATDVEGLRGLLRDGEHALVVPVGDVARLSGAIGDVLDQPGAARERAGAGRRLFADRFGLDVYVARMVDLYGTMLRRADREQSAR